MTDPRIAPFADLMIHHSLKLQPGESVLLEATDVPPEAVAMIVSRIHAAGARPLVALNSSLVQRQLLLGAAEGGLGLQGDVERYRMAAVDAYIGIRGSDNISEQSDVPPAHLQLYSKLVSKPVHFDLRVPRGRWVVTRWPNSAMAQLAAMSTAAFTDYYFAACTLDYARLAEAVAPLVALMQRTDRVRLVGPGTDLRFSIRDIPVVPCCGECNVPDGEVFTAPVRDSVEGTIRFNTPGVYQGTVFENVVLRFEQGRVVAATGSPQDRLDGIFETDEGARYVGEFALGIHPRITQPMRDVLFDEKIAGSFHFTPGNAYDDADNGNRSQIHWDLVMLQDSAHGGGEIWFDDVLVRQDGEFVLPELRGLNPAQLLSAT